jgi:hypothetical protein
MAGLLDRRAVCRGLLSLLVVLLVLGHLCDLEAFADLADHHHPNTAAGHTELLSACDPAPAASSPTPAQVWTALAASGDVPGTAAGPARAPRRSETFTRLVDRPPLFLLHASFLL